METATEQISTILSQAKTAERPNFQQLHLAIESVFCSAKATVLDELRMLMSAKLQNPPLPELKF